MPPVHDAGREGSCVRFLGLLLEPLDDLLHRQPLVSGKNRKTKATIRRTGVENVLFLRLTGFGDLARH